MSISEGILQSHCIQLTSSLRLAKSSSFSSSVKEMEDMRKCLRKLRLYAAAWPVVQKNGDAHKDACSYLGAHVGDQREAIVEESARSSASELVGPSQLCFHLRCTSSRTSPNKAGHMALTRTKVYLQDSSWTFCL